ncbi:MAG: alpha-mannosidase [Clostridiales bacterium]|nr:alpha-mannosidase [Clostridiales bacterium]
MEFTHKKVKRITEIISPLGWTEIKTPVNIAFCPCDYKSNNTPPDESEFVRFEKNGIWGTTPDSHVWFKVDYTIPEEYSGTPYDLFVNTSIGGWDGTNPEFIVYDASGNMLQALDRNHNSLRLESRGPVTLYFYGYSSLKKANLTFILSLRAVNETVVKLYYDLLIPVQTLELLPSYSSEYANILRVLDDAVNLLDLRIPGSPEFLASAARASAYLEAELYRKNRTDDHKVICIGHTHIDIAWLWTVAQTREKAQRSFATVIALMKRYPEYKFMSSQAYLYKTVKEEAPELYAEIKKMIASGRWEVEGAMWVEADNNLPTGESLVRQIIYGKRFFREEFGVESRVLWLPDAFGYSAALPQILRKSGVDWFVTSKIGWNELNKMPYDLFVWRGIDGTPVNAYFLTAQDKKLGQEPTKTSTYNGKATPAQINGTWERFQQKDVIDEALLTFGYGDGGGGPNEEMLETLRRHRHALPGGTAAEIGFAGDFLRRTEAKMANNPRVPEWRGELYLEFHRGTYTSIAKNKRNNRKSEFLALDAELLATLAELLAGHPFPAGQLRKIWEMILTNQFHDILPGSSIKEVYEVTDREYNEIREALEGIINDAVSVLVDRIKTDEELIVFNPHSFDASGIIEHGGDRFFVGPVPAKGWLALTPRAKKTSCVIGERRLENDFFLIEFDRTYTITRIYDKRACREVLPAGKRANELRVHEDFPYKYDAWDISMYVNDKVYLLDQLESAEPFSDSAGAGYRVTRRWGSSTIVQNIRIYDDIPTIDFETEADWHEHHQLLRAAFPADVNTDRATFDIQFGSIERPTHKNTPWDRMKFETCAHKYADLSDGGYGISLMNDCKYGYDVHGDTVCISLIKCATHPNPDADQGRHVFTYSLHPHAGSLAESDTQKLAYLLNHPLRPVAARHGSGELPESYSLVSVDSDNIFLETVKKAENGDGYILRMYEAKNKLTRFCLHFGFDVRSATLCDLLERPVSELRLENNTLCLVAKPFEILTVRVN